MTLARFLYRTYGGSYRLQQWLSLHITPAGALLSAAVIMPGLFGLLIFKTSLLKIFTLAIGLGMVSLISNFLPFSAAVKVMRILPEAVTADAPSSYDIELTNMGPRVQKGLTLFEQTIDPRPDLNTLLSRAEPDEHLRNAWDRKTLVFRWYWLIRKKKKAEFKPLALPDLPPGETVRIRVDITARHRGYIDFDGVFLARPDILGIFRRTCRIRHPQRLLVLPRRYHLPLPEQFSSRQYQPGGISQASSIGNSTEFISLRPYRPGDPLKNIHWRSFAKTGELIIKEFEDEFFVRQALIIDTDLTIQNETVFEAAISISASFVSTLQGHESILDLMFAGSRVYSFSTGRGLSHSEKLLEVLACLEPRKKGSISDVRANLEQKIGRFSGAVCVFLDWTCEHKTLVEQFILRKIPLFVVVIKDRRLPFDETGPAQTCGAGNFRVIEAEEVMEKAGQS